MASTTSKSERNRGVIESYPEFLPVSASTPVVSLGEGNTPLIYCSQLSKRAGRGCEVFVKNEGVNPDRIAGQKTAAYEIIDEIGDAPDFHLLPVGNAGNIAAYWVGYQEYHAYKRSTKLPAMIGFQAAGAAPIFYNRIIEKPETVASAIRIGNPASWKQARGAIAKSRGAIDVVSDAEILAAQSWLAQHEGIFVEPASAASIAGLFKCCDSGDAAYSFQKIPEASRIVCTVTGHGLKDPDLIIQRMKELKPVSATTTDVRHAIGL